MSPLFLLICFIFSFFLLPLFGYGVLFVLWFIGDFMIWFLFISIFLFVICFQLATAPFVNPYKLIMIFGKKGSGKSTTMVNPQNNNK